MEEEIWKDIPGYEGLYLVSSLGRIKSYDRPVGTKGRTIVIRGGRILKPIPDQLGYCKVTLSKFGKHKDWRIHRIVATVFVDNPHGYNVVNHKDRNPSNNAASNLEWCDVSYNVTYDGARQRSTRTRYRNRFGFKPVAQYDRNGTLLAVYESTACAAMKTGCYQGAISNNCIGRAKTAGGFIWRYADGIKFEDTKQITTDPQ